MHTGTHRPVDGCPVNSINISVCILNTRRWVMEVKTVLRFPAWYIFIVLISSMIVWRCCFGHALESLDFSRNSYEKKKKKRQGLWSTMSIRNSQQDARTIGPPFSWPFPMVPSRLHCHSDNGDRRVCRPSVSCCCHSSMWLDSTSSGGVTAWTPAFRVLWDSEHILNYNAQCLKMQFKTNELLKFKHVFKAEIIQYI